jgi:spore coat protein A
VSISRRDFLRSGGVATAGLTLGLHREIGAFQQARPHVMAAPTRPPGSLRADTLARFVDPLPIPPRAQPTGRRNDPSRDTVCYRAVMSEVHSRVHRDLPPTMFWSFGGTFPGPTFEARRGQGLWIEWVNRLPRKHFLPIDHTIHGAEADKPEGRAVVHVHGARVAPEHDGYPDHWFDTGHSATSYYPNDQDATTLWYHDHTMGINRLNVYAGLMGVYLIRDAAEDALSLPRGAYDVPLLICDRLLLSNGQLDYPTSGDPDMPWVEDASGDAILVNGKLAPYFEVQPRKYRFRLINGSNSRFLRLSIDEGVQIHQIATDQGLMAQPVDLPVARLAPAERCDVVVDFAGHQGAQIVLSNDQLPILQFRVSRGEVVDDSTLPATLRSLRVLNESDASQTRVHSLGEQDDLVARPMRMLLNNTRWHAPVTERPTLGSTEIWSLVNETDDSHPIHLHLVRFQILDRRNFDLFNFHTQKRIVHTGPAVPPDRSEMGWKDTVRAEPRMVTRIIVPFEGFAGRYMWHCHLLEHGDNEMMRPFDIVAP